MHYGHGRTIFLRLKHDRQRAPPPEVLRCDLIQIHRYVLGTEVGVPVFHLRVLGLHLACLLNGGDGEASPYEWTPQAPSVGPFTAKELGNRVEPGLL